MTAQAGTDRLPQRLDAVSDASVFSAPNIAGNMGQGGWWDMMAGVPKTGDNQPQGQNPGQNPGEGGTGFMAEMSRQLGVAGNDLGQGVLDANANLVGASDGASAYRVTDAPGRPDTAAGNNGTSDQESRGNRRDQRFGENSAIAFAFANMTAEDAITRASREQALQYVGHMASGGAPSEALQKLNITQSTDNNNIQQLRRQGFVV